MTVVICRCLVMNLSEPVRLCDRCYVAAQEENEFFDVHRPLLRKGLTFQKRSTFSRVIQRNTTFTPIPHIVWLALLTFCGCGRRAERSICPATGGQRHIFVRGPRHERTQGRDPRRDPQHHRQARLYRNRDQEAEDCASGGAAQREARLGAHFASSFSRGSSIPPLSFCSRSACCRSKRRASRSSSPRHPV